MLGRFVVPAARLTELGRAASAHFPDPDSGGLAPGRPEPAHPRGPWRLSALVGADQARDAALIEAFNDAHAGRAVVDAVELKAADSRQVDEALAALPAGITAFVEVSLDENLVGLLAALKQRGARAKLRTGGVVPEAIPEPADVARFIAACAAAGVPFKATAGLHHPVRAEQALTYEAASPRALMHGFLNVFAAAVFARAGASEAELEAVLREQDGASFGLDETGLRWRRLRAATAAVLEARRDFASSFGSCSFAEPVADLRALGVLAGREAAFSEGTR